MNSLVGTAKSAQGIFAAIVSFLLGAAAAAAIEVSTGRSAFDIVLGIF